MEKKGLWLFRSSLRLAVIALAVLLVLSLLLQLASRTPAAESNPLIPFDASVELPTFEDLNYEFVINVFAWRRAAALKILCESLAKANFGSYTVPLHFYVDGGATEDVLRYVEGFSWKYGEKLVLMRQSRLGLEENIATSCVTDGFPASDNRLCFFFEDDSTVSPHFFQWTLKQLAAGHNPQNPQLVGIALNGLRVDQYSTRRYFNDNRPAAEQLTFPPMQSPKYDKSGWSWYGPFLPHGSLGGSVFLLQQPSSWGSVYFSRHWERFQQFWEARREQETQGLRVDLMHSRSTQWDNSWKRHMLDYMYLHGCYMLYPNYPSQLSLATTRRQLGEHTPSTPDEFTSWVFVTPLDRDGTSLTDRNPSIPSFFDYRFRKTTEEELVIIGCAAHRMLGVANDACERTTPHAITNVVAARLAPTIPDLTVFTTLKLPDKLPTGKLPTPERMAFTQIEEMWPRVELLVFASPNDCNAIRDLHYVRCVNEDLCRHPTEKRPTVGCLFQSARDYPGSGSLIAYSNSDIVHSTTLLPALDAIKREYSNYMAIGCRTNVRYDPETEELDMSTAARHAPWAIDYFVMPKSSRLVGEIPAFLIGSTRFDNWIVMKGLQDPEMTVVDITEAHTVLHPYPAKETLKASADRDGTAYNALLAGPNFRLGRISYSQFAMDPGFRVHPNPLHKQGMDFWRNNSVEWAMQFEAEKLTDFKRYISPREGLYFLVAHLHPTISKVSGIAPDRHKVQKLLGEMRPTDFSAHSVLLTPSAFLGKRAWTFQEVLEKVLGKQSIVTENVPCTDSEQPRTGQCWIQRSEDASLLVVDNSEELVLQHPSIYETLRADPSLLLLTRLSFEQLLTERRNSESFRRLTTPVETDPLTMLRYRNLGCIYALPSDSAQLSDSWDSETRNWRQEPESHRFSTTIYTLKSAVRNWVRRRNPASSVTLLCFPYRALAESGSAVTRA
jgi:hypothetical protein